MKDKVALVTGATSGIGRAIALRYAREGARVMCADIRPEPDPAAGDKECTTVLSAIQSIGATGRFEICDVSREDDVKAVVQATVDAFGRIDIAVANAGIGFANLAAVQEPLADFERTVAVNQTGAWLTCREAAAQMIVQGGDGRLIVTASVAGLVAFPWSVAYNASKGGGRVDGQDLGGQARFARYHRQCDLPGVGAHRHGFDIGERPARALAVLLSAGSPGGARGHRRGGVFSRLRRCQLGDRHRLARGWRFLPRCDPHRDTNLFQSSPGLASARFRDGARS